MKRLKFQFPILLLFIICLACEEAIETSSAKAQKAPPLFEKAVTDLKKDNFPSADSLFQLVMEQAKVNGDTLLQARCLNNLSATWFEWHPNDEKGSIYFYEALALYKAMGDSIRTAQTLFNLGLWYKKIENYPVATRFLLESIKFSEESSSNEKSTLFNSYTVLGNLERKLQHLDQSLHLLEKADALIPSIPDSLTKVGSSFLHRAETLRDLKKLNEASALLEKAVTIFVHVNDSSKWSSALAQKGMLALLNNENDAAFKLFQKSLLIRKNLGGNRRLASAFNHLGEFYIQTGQFAVAEMYLDSAFQYSQKANSKEYILDNMNSKIELYKQAAIPAKALEWLEKKSLLQDSLKGEVERYVIADLRISYEVEKVKRELYITEIEHQKSEDQLSWSVSIGILIAVLAILAFRSYLQKSRDKNRIDHLLLETHHRIKNNLQTISGLFSWELEQLKKLQDSAKKPEIIFKEAKNRLRAMQLVHENLCQAEEGALANIQLDTYLHGLIGNIGITMSQPHVSIQQVFQLTPVLLDMNLAVRLGLIINELVANVYHHAFRTPFKTAEPQLIISMKMKDDALCQIIIQDNGKGFDATKLKEDSLGLSLVHILTKELNGKIHFSTENGTCSTLQLPVK